MAITDLTILTSAAEEQLRARMKEVAMVTTLVAEDKDFAHELFKAVAYADKGTVAELFKKAGVEASDVTIESTGTRLPGPKVQASGKVCYKSGKWEVCVTVEV